MKRARGKHSTGAVDHHDTIEAALADALAGYGVTLTPRASGRFERFDTPDKPKGNGNGWYRIHGPQAASFGIWHLDVSEVVTLHGASDPEAAAQARLDAMRDRERQERERQQQAAKTADEARRWWADAGPGDPAHPWLAGKRLPPYNLRQRGEMLLVPLYFEGELVNLERIFPDGSKRPLKGGRVKGVASLIGRLAGAERVLVAEGWSTAAALHEAMGCPVVVARNADNLAPVARRLRQRLPDEVGITICGDDDRHLPAQGLANKGRVAARHAALAIDATLLMPSFCARCETCTDFADTRLCWLGGGRGQPYAYLA
ncbi:toprim domain-containing protein [Modicisalibacter tunisiensis]|uniref:Toprim domain-containing protein n=1 Tax=Modicisalibacter tunisiensis TaxID=390637 RepID=A0ABS7X1Q4_9GAMM|nr:toprim domain-containing protein [Modicisalibacter tunisiensis]MBZ9568500.1 toprim domain-containing protein [Modicisalibacter tunisiensis]